jgi:hypothetical protein
MKNIYKSIKISVVAGLLLATACSDRLEILDPDTLPPEVALASFSGYQSLMLSGYNRINDFTWYGQQGMIHPEIMADNVDFANRTGRYESEYVNAVRAHMGRWDRWGGINDANIIYNRVDNVEDGTAGEKNGLKGEALFIRALNYHELAKVYGYEPGKESSGFNLTVPLKIQPTEGVSDAFVPQTRVANSELYSQLVSDLTESASLLSSNPAGSFPYRASAASAYALLSRVQLYKGDYAAAAAAAQQAISAATSLGTALTSGENYMNSWAAAPHPESIFESEIRTADWNSVDGVNNSLHSLTMNTTPSAQFILVGSPELISAIESEDGDIRRGLWVDAAGIPAGSQMCTKWRGEAGDFRENVPVIRISEMYLTAAEGLARSNNDSGARTIYNQFREARGLAATSASGQALINLIMKDRRVEFAMEGHRWFDLKRLGMDITKTAASAQPTLAYSDFRLLSFLPESELNLDDALTQNPGY